MTLPGGALVFSNGSNFTSTQATTTQVTHNVGTLASGSYGTNPALLLAIAQQTYIDDGSSAYCPFGLGGNGASYSLRCTFPGSVVRTIGAGGGGLSPFYDGAGGGGTMVADPLFNQGCTIDVLVDFFNTGHTIKSQAVIYCAVVAMTGAIQFPATQTFGTSWSGGGGVGGPTSTGGGTLTMSITVDPDPYSAGLFYFGWNPSAPATTVDETNAGWYDIGNAGRSITGPSGAAAQLRVATGLYIPQVTPDFTGAFTPGISTTPWEFSPMCNPGSLDTVAQNGSAVRIIVPAVTSRGKVMVVG